MSSRLRLGAQKKSNNKGKIAVGASVLAVAVTGFAMIASPIAKIASAISMTSLSQIAGPTSGGNELTIHGSGFIADENYRITQVYSGPGRNYAVTLDGRVFAWGQNRNGQLGNGENTDINIPQEITDRFGSEKVVQIAAGGYHSVALMESGAVYAWGLGSDGQIGNGSNNEHNMPQDITAQFGSEVVKQVAASWYHSLALTESGKVFAWGLNKSGQLGTGNNMNYNTPQDITAGFGQEKIKYLSAGTDYSLALTNSGKIFSWGENSWGQLALGDTLGRNLPQDASAQFGSEVVKFIEAGGGHATALTTSGKVLTWGFNDYGQLANGTYGENKNIPQDVTMQFGSESLVQVASGGSHSVGLTNSNKVLTWGANNGGQLGVDDNDQREVPQDITSRFGGEKIVLVTAKGANTTALSETGKLFVWGNNTYGQIGNGNNASQRVPLDISSQFVLGQATVVQVAAIRFGSSEVEEFEVIDANTIRVVVPAHEAGKVDVVITSIYGVETALVQGYEYLAPGVPNTGA